MKYILVIALICAFCAGAAAQQKKYEFQEECGDPSVESVLWTSFSAKVTQVIDGDSIVVKQSNGKQTTVDLTAINSASNEAAAKAFLTDNLLKKKIEITTSTSFALENTARVWGLVYLKEQEVNRLMIEKGISLYRAPAPYEFSVYKACVYQKLETIAKQEKAGIWAK